MSRFDARNKRACLSSPARRTGLRIHPAVRPITRILFLVVELSMPSEEKAWQFDSAMDTAP